MKKKQGNHKFKILLDMDEVTVSLFDKWIPWIHEHGDPNLKLEHIRGWDVADYTEIGKKCYDFFHQEGIFNDLKPLPDAVKIINHLKLDHELVFCTQVPHNTDNKIKEKHKEEKIIWCQKHFKWFEPTKHIIFSSDKSREDGDILFDDRWKWLAEFPNVSVAMDAPYNQDFSGFRVKTWVEFKELVDNLSLCR